MTVKRSDKIEDKCEKSLESHYSEIGSAALRGALLCMRKNKAADKPSGSKKAA